MKYIQLILFLLTIGPSFAKRLAPESLDALYYRKGVIEHTFERNSDEMTVSIVAKDKSGDLRWKTKLYKVIYKKNLETDVQDVHLKKVYLEENQVVAVDELGKSYRLDLADGHLSN